MIEKIKLIRNVGLAVLLIAVTFSCASGRVQVGSDECAGLSGSADSYLNSGDIEYDRRNMYGALENYKKALCKAPRSVNVHLSMGMALASLDRLDEALAHTDYILKELNPDSIAALTNKGLFFQKAGRFNEAKRIHLEILKNRPSDGPALLNLGLVEHQLGNDREAVRRFEEFLKLYPRNVMGLSNLAAIYSGMGEFEKAEELFRRSLSIDPDDYATHQNLANRQFSFGANTNKCLR